eukprot:2573896-Prymnesium_polylepis.1
MLPGRLTPHSLLDRLTPHRVCILLRTAGVAYCVPQLLFGRDVGLFTGGFYPSVCTHASSYGMGESGFFVALFIYSKLVRRPTAATTGPAPFACRW